MLRYTVILTQQRADGAVEVYIPALPGVFTWGETIGEAMCSAREAIKLHLESYVERGQPFPADRRSAHKDALTIEVGLPPAARVQGAGSPSDERSS
jgi:predicted RNase H-like HicB family nuclease